MRVLICARAVGVADLLSELLPQDQILSCPAKQVETAAREADVLIPIMTPLRRQTLEASPACLIQQFGSGIESIDLATATELGMYVARIPSEHGNAHSVAVACASLDAGTRARSR